MKKWYIISFIALFMGSFGNPKEAKAQGGDRVSFQTFYNELEPYGRWVQEPEYGYVWIPDVGPGFQPYGTNGHWIVTEYGNTWVSDYSWGWAPFHYGRWEFDDYYGWFWVPGEEWGPAWVSWRSGGDYYGWAPLPPRVSVHISINIPLVRWVFVPRRYITSPRIYNYCIPRAWIKNVYHNTYIINNYYERDNRRYAYGPGRNDIERATRSRVIVHKVDNSTRPGRAEVRNGSVNIYRPEVYRADANNERPSRTNSRIITDRNHRSNSSDSRIGNSTAPANSNRNNVDGRERTRPSRSETVTREDREGSAYTRPAARENANNNRPEQPSSIPAQRERPQRSQPSRQDQGQRNQETQARPRTESSRPSASQTQRRETERGETERSSSRSGGRPQRD